MIYNRSMASKKALRCAALAAAACVCALCGCGGGNEKKYYFDEAPTHGEYLSSGSTALKLFGYAMGTELALVLTEPQNFSSPEVYSRAGELWESAQAVIKDVEDSVSVTYEGSFVYKFNAAEAGAKVPLNQTAYEILSLARELYTVTGGYYNPAVYDSAELYGFSTGVLLPSLSVLPATESVEACRTLSTYFDEMQLIEENGAYYAVKPNKSVTVDGEKRSLRLDLGGIGKGWCADKISALIDEAGFDYGYFSFAESSMSIKKYLGNESEEFTVSVRNPRASGRAYSLKIADSDLSTSGDNERYYTLDGKRYCHIIDPTTGSPIQTGVASVTVVGGSAAEDDAYTTAIAAMGAERAAEFINANLADRTVAMLVFSGGQGKIITNRPDEVTVVGDYALGNTVTDGKIILG